MKVATVLVTYNRLAKLKLAVSTILEQSIDYVVVVNNNSSDGTREWLDSLTDPRLRIEHLQANTGGAGGFYAGCRYAAENLDADWVLLFDDDAYPAPDLMSKFRALNLPTKVAAVTSAVYTPNGVIADFNRPGANPFKSIGKFINYLVKGHYLNYDQLANAREIEVDLASFVGLFVRTDVIKTKLGYPLKDLFIYCDDWLYTLELSKLGYKNWYFSDLIFYHDSKTFIDDYDSQLWKKYYNYRNSIYFYKRAAGLFFPIVISVKLLKWFTDARLYKNKEEYFKTLKRSVVDGFKFKGVAQ